MMMTLSSSSPSQHNSVFFLIYFYCSPLNGSRSIGAILSVRRRLSLRNRRFNVQCVLLWFSFLSKSHTMIASSCGQFMIRFDEMNTQYAPARRAQQLATILSSSCFLRLLLPFPRGWAHPYWVMEAQKWFLSSRELRIQIFKIVVILIDPFSAFRKIKKKNEYFLWNHFFGERSCRWKREDYVSHTRNQFEFRMKVSWPFFVRRWIINFFSPLSRRFGFNRRKWF